MKVVILCGGLGTRLSEDTDFIPKPLVRIGDKPILWHIMKLYQAHGLNDFVLCLGYKGEAIKKYFREYAMNNSDVMMSDGSTSSWPPGSKNEDWKVTLVDTGEDTMTGGRLKRVRDYLGSEVFCLTYADGLSNLDIKASIAFHRKHKRLATMAVVRPPSRFGTVNIADDSCISAFVEKGPDNHTWINGGFFVLDPQVVDIIEGDGTVWENGPIQHLIAKSQLMAYQHEGFWHPMDTLHEKRQLEKLWQQGNAPWKTWQ